MLQDLSDDPAELEAEIALLADWLQTTQSLLAARGIVPVDADAPRSIPSSMDCNQGMRRDNVAGFCVGQATEGCPVGVQQMLDSAFPQPRQGSLDHRAAHDAVGTERSLGAIDAALRAQGFR